MGGLRAFAIHTECLAEAGDGDMLGHVQANQPIKKADPEEPEIDRHAGHQPEHRRDADLEPGSCHALIMRDARPCAKVGDADDQTSPPVADGMCILEILDAFRAIRADDLQPERLL